MCVSPGKEPLVIKSKQRRNTFDGIFHLTNPSRDCVCAALFFFFLLNEQSWKQCSIYYITSAMIIRSLISTYTFIRIHKVTFLMDWNAGPKVLMTAYSIFHICNYGFGILINFDAVLRFFLRFAARSLRFSDSPYSPPWGEGGGDALRFFQPFLVNNFFELTILSNDMSAR